MIIIIALLSSLLSLLVEVAGVGRALDLGRDGGSEGAGGETLPVKTLELEIKYIDTFNIFFV